MRPRPAASSTKRMQFRRAHNGRRQQARRGPADRLHHAGCSYLEIALPAPAPYERRTARRTVNTRPLAAKRRVNRVRRTPRGAARLRPAAVARVGPDGGDRVGTTDETSGPSNASSSPTLLHAGACRLTVDRVARSDLAAAGGDYINGKKWAPAPGRRMGHPLRGSAWLANRAERATAWRRTCGCGSAVEPVRSSPAMRSTSHRGPGRGTSPCTIGIWRTDIVNACGRARS